MGVLDTALAVLERQSGKSANVTLKTLTLGARDSTTGWCAKSFADSTIKMQLKSNGAPFVVGSMGFYSKYPVTGYTSTAVLEGNEVYANSKYYCVNTSVPVYVGGEVDHYQLDLEKRVFDNTPATYGTGATIDDSRKRTKTFLDTYLVAANLTKDNGATQAAFVVMWNNPPYHVAREFIDNAKDLLFVVSPSVSDPQLTYNHKAYAYLEQVPITIYVANKSGITGENLKNKAEQEIRRIAETYPATINLRYLRQGKPIETSIINLYAYEYMLNYMRAVETAPTKPSITWGPSATPTGTYILPNVTSLDIEPESSIIRLNPFGRIGSIPQKNGAPDYTITIKCNLDMEPTALTWKRPQTTSPKTDAINEQVFYDIYFNGLSSQEYQTLDLGYGGTIKVTMEKPQVTKTATVHEATLTFKAYSASAPTTYTGWFGIS